MINALRIKNLRSLTDTDDISLRPLNILVGKNSSGKSTFARVFPLLRQSIEAETTGPILWYGRFVDFGSFSEAVSIGTEEDKISFKFHIDYPLSREDLSKRPSLGRAYPFARNFNTSLDKTSAKVEITLARSGEKESAHLDSLSLTLYDVEIQLKTSSGGQLASYLRINDHVWEPSEDSRLYLGQGSIFPRLNFARRRKIKTGNVDRRMWRFEESPFKKQLEQLISSKVHGRTQEERIEQIATQLYIAPEQEFIARIKNISGAPSSWYQNTKHFSSKNKIAQRLRHLTFALRLPNLLKELDATAQNFFSNIRYIEPLRATAERYYRRQDLAVEEIDSKGTNVAMFLNSLPPHERSAFERWMDEIFGAHVYAESEFGHISLRLQEQKSKSSVNIADVGFGFSQVLPLAVQLWSAAYKPRRHAPSSTAWLRASDTSAIVIEQPELHLHPEFQSRLGDMLAETLNIASVRGHSLKIIVETHSSALINRLGERVSMDDISSEDINICLFERGSTAFSSSVRITEFNEEGVLKNWPFGFFEPEVY